MLKQRIGGGASLAIAALLTVVAALPAAARIECRGMFQVSPYGLIATPYCEEEEIARVARSYGISVSGAEVRNSPLRKVYLCQRIGNDTRLKGACGAYAPDVYGR
jgi:hypothetical protein